MVDSNVLMPRDYVARMFQAWGSDTGLVCSPPLGCAGASFGIAKVIFFVVLILMLLSIVFGTVRRPL